MKLFQLKRRLSSVYLFASRCCATEAAGFEWLLLKPHRQQINQPLVIIGHPYKFVCATPRADSFEISSISKTCFVHINSRFCAFCCGFRCSSFTPRAKKRETQKKATRSRIAVSFSSLHPGPPTSYHACVALSVV